MTDIVGSLLPCPFCGAAARTDLLPHSGGPGWVQCSECECDQYMCDTIEEAVAKWNRRAPAQTAPRMTLDEWFLKFNSWGLSHQQLLTCAFAPGSDPGDDVYTSPSGSVMTRHICSHWINFYGAAQAGWNAALSSAHRKENSNG
jgi:hypothetical protein